MATVRILAPTYEATQITEENMGQVRTQVSAGDDINVKGEPIAVGDWAVMVKAESDNPYLVIPPEYIEVVEP